MTRFNRKKAIGEFLWVVGVTGVLTVNAMAQYGGGGGGTAGGATGAIQQGNNYHVGFDRPEAWGLKYFASTTMLSGLQPPAPPEGRRIGSVTVGLELGWLPTLDAGQRRIGFNDKGIEDLNKAPMMVRPVVRVGLPGKFTFVAGAPPPFRVFGVTPHLLAFGLERPVLERERWTLNWRGYGQAGSVKGAFSCPQSVLAFAPGSPDNAKKCVGESADVASLRYAGSEFQFAYRIPSVPKMAPHVAAGGNFIDGVYQGAAQE